MKILVAIPVLNRPQRVQPLLDDLRSSQQDVKLEPLFIVSSSDTPEVHALMKARAPFLTVDWAPEHGDFARKMQYAYEETDEEWIFQAADDVSFAPGWADHAIATAEETGALVIGTQDGGNPSVKSGNHSTHTLIKRTYCDAPGASLDGPGTIFTTAYSHQWTDTELVELAKHRGVWAFSHDSIVTHHHPMWSKGQMDATYQKGLADSRADHQTFLQRKSQWEALPAAR